MKKAKINGAKAMLSMLSLFLAFVVMCVLCLSLLSRLGFIDFSPSNDDDDPKHSSSIGDPQNSGVDGDYNEITLDENDIRNILSDIPFYDSFYAKIYTTYIGSYGVDGKGGNFKIEAYEVYRLGEKYVIKTYNSMMQLVKTVVCDGERVKITDHITLGESIFDAGELFTFENQAPLPDFSISSIGKYDIVDVEHVDGEYIIKCSMTDMNVDDEVHIDENSGIITYFCSSSNGKTRIEYTLNTFSNDQKFDDSMFFTEK